MLKGITAHIPICADATHLFVFRSTASGVATAIGTLTSDPVSRGACSDGSLVKAKLASLSPADFLLQPIFNPVGGYASYVVPAAFILILQQTLLIGSALLTRGAVAKGGGADAGVLGRGFAHMTIYLPAVALYLIVLPHIYGFSTLGHLPQLFALAAVFPAGDELHGAGCRSLVHEAGERDHSSARNQPAAILHGRLRLAARGHSRGGPGVRQASSPLAPARSMAFGAQQPARCLYLGGRA